jgi:hypothetical protein
VHARLGRRFIDREEADFQDLATSESTITFAFGRPNFDDCAAALWIITPAVMSEFDADEFFFYLMAMLLDCARDALPAEVAAL